MTAASREAFLTVGEAAKVCHLSRVTVYRLIENGELPALRTGTDEHGPLRVPVDELQAWLETVRTDRRAGTNR